MRINQNIAGVELTGFNKEETQVVVTPDWRVLRDGGLTDLSCYSALAVASLIELADQPVRVRELANTATRLYLDASERPGFERFRRIGPVVTSDISGSVQHVGSSPNSPVRAHVYQLGPRGPRKLTFFSADISEVEVGVEKIKQAVALNPQIKDDLTGKLTDEYVETYRWKRQNLSVSGKESSRTVIGLSPQRPATPQPVVSVEIPKVTESKPETSPEAVRPVPDTGRFVPEKRNDVVAGRIELKPETSHSGSTTVISRLQKPETLRSDAGLAPQTGVNRLNTALNIVPEPTGNGNGESDRMAASRQRRAQRLAAATGIGRKRTRTRSQSDAPADDTTREYLKDIGKVDLLTKEDEVRLGELKDAGKEAQTRLDSGVRLSRDKRQALERQVELGEAAKKEFVEANLRLVVSVARRYKPNNLSLLDLVQEGNMGLMHAVEKFDYRKGFKFSTYATWWIRQAITRGLANTDRTIRWPVHAGDDVGRVDKMIREMTSESGEKPTIDDLSVALGWKPEKVSDVLALRHSQNMLSLDSPVGDSGEAELKDFVSDRTVDPTEDEALRDLLPAQMEQALSHLDEREREIVSLRFGLDGADRRSLEEVGLRFGLTRERIRQIEAKALSKLRHPSVVGLLGDL